MTRYTITLEVPNKIEPANINHFMQILRQPDTKFFITKIEVTP